MRHPKVSILVTDHGNPEHLATCLDSLRSVDYPEKKLETIILSGRPSHHGMKSINERSPGVKVIRSGRLDSSIRLAVSLSKGDILAFLNCNSRVDRDWLKPLVESLSPENQVVCVSSQILTSSKNLEWSGRDIDAFGLEFHAASVPSTPFGRNENLVLFASANAMAIFRRTYLIARGFDPEYLMCDADVDLGWRLWMQGYQIRLVRESIVSQIANNTDLNVNSKGQLRVLKTRNMMYTMIKNLEDDNLMTLLPSVLAFLSHTLRDNGQLHTLSDASLEVFENLKHLVARREAIQGSRTRSDSEIFTKAGHPFQFLLSSEHMARQQKTSLRAGNLAERVKAILINSLSLNDELTSKDDLIRQLRGEKLSLYSDRLRLQRQLRTLEASLGYRLMKFYGPKIDALLPNGTYRGKIKLSIKRRLRVPV